MFVAGDEPGDAHGAVSIRVVFELGFDGWVLEGGGDAVSVAGKFFEARQGQVVFDAARVDEYDPVGKFFHVGEVVAGEDDGFATVFQFRKGAAQSGGFDGVEADGGFVEQQDGGVGAEAHGNVEALFHAFGVFLDSSVGCVDEPHAVEDAGELGFRQRGTADGGKVGEVFPRGEHGVESAVAAEDRHNVLAGVGCRRHHVGAENVDGTRGGVKPGGEDFTEGGFAGAVHAENGRGLPRRNSEGDIGECGEFFPGGAKGAVEVARIHRGRSRGGVTDFSDFRLSHASTRFRHVCGLSLIIAPRHRVSTGLYRINSGNLWHMCRGIGSPFRTLVLPSPAS